MIYWGLGLKIQIYELKFAFHAYYAAEKLMENISLNSTYNNEIIIGVVPILVPLFFRGN